MPSQAVQPRSKALDCSASVLTTPSRERWWSIYFRSYAGLQLKAKVFDGLAMKPGVEVLEDVSGLGPVVRRHVYYDVRLRMWLSRGESVRWNRPWGLLERARIEDDGATLFTTLKVDRECMFAGLFYGVDGMRVGGIRRLKVAPHLAYREKGIDGVVPPNALLTVEVHIIAER